MKAKHWAGSLSVMGSLVLAQVATADTAAFVAQGDAAWVRRADGQVDGKPKSGPIAEAVDAYGRAAQREPANLDATWRLLRALFFQGDAATPDRTPAQQAIFDRGKQVCESALDLAATRIGGREALQRASPDALRTAGIDPKGLARTYFWGVLHWGLWAQAHGAIASVREGVAGRIRNYSERVIALEPDYESGGGHRVLGRMHAIAPRIPFFTGWIDRERAVVELERARAIDPEFPGNKLMLAVTLLDLVPERKAEAQRLLHELSELTPRPARLVEDLNVRRDARRLLGVAAGGSAAD